MKGNATNPAQIFGNRSKPEKIFSRISTQIESNFITIRGLCFNDNGTLTLLLFPKHVNSPYFIRGMRLTISPSFVKFYKAITGKIPSAFCSFEQKEILNMNYIFIRQTRIC